jgi:gamma-glutamylcyclotransferase (GGCT)/AIG2-like uncharacterized protein YtfP
MLHFAYGSNMNHRLMRTNAPQARALGIARLPGFRFIITRDGYASVLQDSSSQVHGVLWQLTPHDRRSLDAYESVETGLYRRAMLLVCRENSRGPALVYLARSSATGAPRPGYLDAVLQAACEWELPDAYIDSLRRWGRRRARAVETGDLA